MAATLDRRQALARILAAAGGAAALFPAIAARERGGRETLQERIRRCGWLSGLEFTDDEIALMLEGVEELLADLEKLRGVPLDNGVPPALHFRPRGTPQPGGSHFPTPRGAAPFETAAPARPASDEALAFLPLGELAALLRSRQVSSRELTGLYLERLRRYDPVLHCVISFTEDLAYAQAERADRELAAGRYRGPLHGIPWGAKDLLAVPGYRTTWGAKPFEAQQRPEKATVVARLEEAGAVLVAKLSVGALAWGDVWFGGKTRNPWNPQEGSSGSSAGSAAAVAAGLVGFAIGTETWGSIVSPCTRCGATGLRPTFGRVSRYGTMALAWSMDKIGPIARSVEDCALVFAAIHGADGLDLDAVSHPFAWPPAVDPRTLRVGYLAALFEEDRAAGIQDPRQRDRVRESQSFDRATLEILRDLGFELVPVALPETYPVGALSWILTVEAAAAFDELTRTGRDDLLVRQEKDAWPNVFRQAQLVPAVEYLRANRIRTLVMQELERAWAEVDVVVAPSFGGDVLLRTNLTGHPCVVVPNGFRAGDGTPTSISFLGRLHGEEALLAVARAYQEATEFHLRRPPLAAAGGPAG